MSGFDTMEFEYQDATVSLTCKYKAFMDDAFVKQCAKHIGLED